ncbi:MAG: hypothetical protein HYR85_19945 [Planctomycetes bacterium]|nr:hypothetical protein [Planctomycetota bacterium]MBI3844502.1 hypothetical protein [Planctomycetota bacterium]
MSRPHASSAIIFGLAIVVAALILRGSSSEVAAAGTTAPRTFSVQIPSVGIDPVVIGTVPAGRRLVLKDFTGGQSLSVSTIEVLVDGVPYTYVRATADGNGNTVLHEHFTAGIVVEGGHQISLRTPAASIPTVLVAGVVE